MFRSFIVARIIGPVMFGTIQALTIFLLYVPVIQMGYFQSLGRELPKILDADDQKAIKQINANGLLVSMSAGLIGLAIYLGIFSLKRQSLDIPAQTAWMIFAGMIALQPLTQFYHAIYSAYGKFTTGSKIRVANGLMFFAMIVLVIQWNYIGQLVSLLISAIMLIGLYYINHPIKIQTAVIDFKHIRKMMRNGAPLLAVAIAFNLFFTIDRIMIVSFRGAEEYGYYALGVLVLQTAMMVPESIRQIAYRRFNIEFGRDLQESRLKIIFWQSYLIVALIMWALAVGGYHVGPHLVRLLLPSYVLGIPMIKTFSITMVFTAQGLLLTNGLQAIYKQRYIFIVYVLSIIYSAVGSIWILTHDRPIYWVAFMMGSSHLLASGLLLIRAVRSEQYAIPNGWLARMLLAYLILATMSLVGTVGPDIIGYVLTPLRSLIILILYFASLAIIGGLFRRKLGRLYKLTDVEGAIH